MHIPNQELKLVPRLRPATFLSLVLPLLPLFLLRPLLPIPLGAKVFVLFLCGVQLVLRSGILTVIDLDKVDVTPSLVEVFLIRSVLSGVGGSAGGWRCCWDAPSLPQLPPATPKKPTPYISLLFSCFCSDGSNQHKIWAAGGKSVFI